MVEMIDNPEVGAHSRLLMAVLSDHANDNRQVWISVNHMAKKMNVSTTTARNSLRDLVRRGHLTATPQDQIPQQAAALPEHSRPTVYTINP